MHWAEWVNVWGLNRTNDRALWTLEYTPQLSVEFKNTVSKYSSQFRGNSQQDALEFLLWLLDRVHEDVGSSPIGNNRKTKASAAPLLKGGPVYEVLGEMGHGRPRQASPCHELVLELIRLFIFDDEG
ncbi:hypothetical protein COCON_G00208740 [Conger conger]|uniref:ubiquitinyl hydrolase 1 n=1 Tax=Conger conger TaxID=82655 RepID=A0A9Q1D0V2_CONCO|nr:hypothetical protein COCON_G00208740 [Conger conger]